jgi:hypothetical protein
LNVLCHVSPFKIARRLCTQSFAARMSTDFLRSIHHKEHPAQQAPHTKYFWNRPLPGTATLSKNPRIYPRNEVQRAMVCHTQKRPLPEIWQRARVVLSAMFKTREHNTGQALPVC